MLAQSISYEDPGPLAGQVVSDTREEDRHPLIRRVHEYWLSIYPAKGLPGRQHLDPVDIPDLLANVRLIEVHGDRPDFRVRLMGTKQVEFYERDFTGQRYHAVFADFPASATRAAFLNVIRTRQPDWRRGPPVFSHKDDYTEVERILLPLASNGEDVDMLMSVLVFR